ncbi:hypothetical protein CP97_14760 [Aurantiacibacter atlanticus]|uniref:Uncharacterized protein n=1 Tax=Aurantiacibacter atlanticus TaxID=1648404 RepID=A0A168M220_9SPHN|nr:hypothetical protein CP97_14760 [Aurantiacibacter atlanticus]
MQRSILAWPCGRDVTGRTDALFDFVRRLISHATLPQQGVDGFPHCE